jgi:hypothetical protein
MRASYRLGLLTVLACGFASVAACGDDGSTSGGAAGQTTTGGSAGSSGAGSGHAGSVASAGVNAGGASSGGKPGTGGASCEIQECFRANVCLDHCGGKVVSSGCCACAAPTVDELSCNEAAGGQGGGTSAECVGMTCSADQTCVAYRTVGGAQIPPDAGGGCTTGKHVENDHCVSDFAYTCAALTGCSAPAATCHCAAGSKCANDNACRLPFEAVWLDAAADLVCEQQVP